MTVEVGLNQNFKYRQAGTTLTFTPNINKLDKVVMSVNIESSKVRTGETLFGGAILDARRFDTSLAVESGHTMVVGGIIRNTESGAVRRVPILGHIPVLNFAFRKKDKRRETTELITFITPTVLRSGAEADKRTDKIIDSFDLIQEWGENEKVRSIIEPGGIVKDESDAS